MIRSFVLALTIFALPAQAQQGVQPSGSFTPGHTVQVLNPSGTAIGDAGGSAGSALPGQNYLTELGITNTGAPLCINDALTNNPAGYHQLCLGANAFGGGVLSYNAVGGATELPLQLIVNGVTTTLPQSGSCIGCGTMAAQNADAVAITGGTITGVTITGHASLDLASANNLSDVANAATSRTNLAIAPHVATSAALQASTTATYPSGVWRDDYAPGNGAPPLWFKPSNSACSLNGGTGDGGSQVPSADSKCWLAVLPALVDPAEWGVSSSPTNFYVATTGTDVGPNWCFSFVHPCSSVQHAVDVALKSLGSGASVRVVNLAAGTYNAGFICTGPIVGGGSSATFDGSLLEIKGASSATTTINDTTSSLTGAIIVSAGCVVELTDLTIMTNRSGASDLFIQNFGIVESGADMVYGAPSATGTNIHIEWGGEFEAFANFTLSGSSLAAIFNGGGILEIDPSSLTITVSGTPTYTNAFLWTAQNGKNYMGLATYTGSANGSRVLVESGAVVDGLNSSIATYLPGSTIPIITSGGIYVAQQTPVLSGTAANCGSTCTVTLASESDATSGDILITPSGSGITANANFNIAFPFQIQKNNGLAHCFLNVSDEGTGGWNAGALALQTAPLAVVSNLNILQAVATNNGSTLSSGSVYHVQYNCPM